MPTPLAVLVAVIAELHLSAALVGLRIEAKLTNDGDEPVSVIVGESCSGPRFKLIVDGKPRPFVGIGHECATPHLIAHTIPARGEYAILSDALDGRHHGVMVRLDGLVSQPIEVPTLVRVDLALAATAHARPGQPIVVEVTHVNRSPEAISIPSCGEDRLLIDGKEQPLPLAQPCRPEPRMLEVRGALVTRGLVTLPPGRHVVRARWRDAQSDDVIVDVGD
jgi:hypothetical protein